jgi:hypothetical protein
VQRQAHDRRLDDLACVQRRLQLDGREPVQPGGQRDVRGGRVLPLERSQQADRLGRVEAPALQQQLARRERDRQLTAG